jgi:TonB family protein
MLAMVTTVAFFTAGCAGQVTIVANPNVKADTITSRELRKVFLAEKSSLADGSRVQPVFQKSGSVHEAFVRDFLGQTPENLTAYYGALVFTGKAATPKAFEGDEQVLEFVKKTPGAIGYIGDKSAVNGVKIVIVSDEERSERRLLTRVEATYPETLRQMKIGGTVRLRLTIAASGKVEEVAVLGGNPILGESAERAVRRWVYAPGPRKSTVDVTVPFDPER